MAPARLSLLALAAAAMTAGCRTSRPQADGVAPLVVACGIITGFCVVALILVIRRRNAHRLLLRTEKERREANEEIHAAFYCLGDGVISANADGRINRMNPIAANLTGWPEAEAVGKPMDEVFRIVDEETRTQVRNPVDSVLGDGRVTRLTRHAVLVARDGTELPIGYSGAPVRDEQGAVSGVVIVFQDLTAERVAQRALQESEAQVRRLVEATNVGTWEWKVQNGEMIFNGRWAEILGYTQAELASNIQNVFELTHPEDVKELENRLGEVLRCRRSFYDLELRARHKDGRWVWVHDQGTVIGWTTDGRPARMAGIRSDISERRTLESQLRQAQKMESVGRLAGGVVHDFNNMLGVILGHTEMAMDALDPGAPTRENLEEIRKAARRSADLTRQLLAFARRQSISPSVLDVNDAVAEMLVMLRRIMGEDIELVWKPGQALWRVKADPTQIHQVLANLTANARDAITGVGIVTIETGNVTFDETCCVAHAGSVPGDYVLLAVSDTGTGMDKETQEHLFEPFFTTKEEGKGTGLGLATVYGAVKQNRGFLTVHSEPGRGTTFNIYLPRAESIAGKPAETAGEPAGGTETLLLAEDEQGILGLGKHILERYGYTVLAARTPAEALVLAERHKGSVHLLITDVVMPGMNGKELSDRLAALCPGVKTLFMSGYTADVMAHHGVIEEGVEFLQKPFSTSTLTQRVHQMLHQV